MSKPTITVHGFAELDPATAYRIWQLRQDVFVVEQQCPYPDLDGRDGDSGTRHVVMRDGRAGVVGYARLLDEGDHVRVGRVVLDPRFRGRGLADDLLRTAIAEARGREIRLAAQSPLAPWYASHGFEVCGPEFLDDGIPHLPLRAL